MGKKLFIILGVLSIILSFGLLILAMLGVASYFIAAPLLFGSILFTVHIINNRNRFKGFNRTSRY